MIPRGLSSREAERRLHIGGRNELPLQGRRTIFRIAGEVGREPMFFLLLGAGSIYMLLGSMSDALMLLGFVLITMVITISQERKTEKALEQLRTLSSPRALVIRDGQRKRIAGSEVALGDLLVLEEGDRIAADGAILDAYDLLIDESLLTGESIAVEKISRNCHTREGQGAGSSNSRVSSGSLIVRGGGMARVTATGQHTELGKIGRSLSVVNNIKSQLQMEIGTLVKRFALFGAALSLFVFLLYGAIRYDWLNGLLVGITLAMSILPEEFTVILAVFMALGAWRIARHHVLTRHTPVIEALGSATVLCVDKTGTLTENRMSLKALVAGEEARNLQQDDPVPLSPAEMHLLRTAVLASEITPFDPMEKALHSALRKNDPEYINFYRQRALVHDYPLTSDIVAMTHGWECANQDNYQVATKGAPESVVCLCRLFDEEIASIMQQVNALAIQGIRVLGVAQAVHASQEWPEKADGFSFEWVGLVGLSDPLRKVVPEAINDCRDAGIRVVMITGDHPVTAKAIALEAGLPDEKVVMGMEIDRLSDHELSEVIKKAHVFARIRPEQKLRLVMALKANGEVVAMTGDGVNDAPALKAADVGISMGERGTDVAREASSLVLLNDDFTSIIRAISLGRQIYSNLRKAMIYVVAVHVPIAGMTLLPLLIGTPLAFAPIHIVFLEMIINPACAIVFEAEPAEERLMTSPPRSTHERLFGVKNLTFSLVQGAGFLATVAVVFFLALHWNLSQFDARAMAFTSVVIGNMALIISSRSTHLHIGRLLLVRNNAQIWIVVGALLALAAVLFISPLQTLFHFGTLHVDDIAFAIAAGIVAIIWFELMKVFFFKGRYRRNDNVQVRR